MYRFIIICNNYAYTQNIISVMKHHNETIKNSPYTPEYRVHNTKASPFQIEVPITKTLLLCYANICIYQRDSL